MENQIEGRKEQADFSSFNNLDIRVGTILQVEEALTKKPTYRLTIDFGPIIGIKVSCGAYRNYTSEELIGKQVIAVVNFGVKQMGTEKSEVLVLGAPGTSGETIYLTTESKVDNGVSVF